MSKGNNYDIPIKFIQQRKQQINQNNQQQGQTFINTLYTQYDTLLLKPINIDQNLQKSNHPFQQSKQNTYRKYYQKSIQQLQKEKRLKKIKNLLRASNLKQQQIVQKVTHKQQIKKYQQTNRLNKRIEKGLNPQQPHQVLQHVQIINADLGLKSLRKTPKTVTYVDTNKIKMGSNIQEQDCIEADAFSKAHNLIPLSSSYSNKLAMYQINRAIHQKESYRFNVQWWQANNKYQKQGGKWLRPENIKNLKRHLKPIRRHKLIASRFAPLSQFTPDGLLQRDGIKNNKMIDSSQSQDEEPQFKRFDRQLQQDYNLPGVIQLDQQEEDEPKKLRLQHKKCYKQVQRQNNRNNEQRQDYLFKHSNIDNNLKRALLKMRKQGWKQDQLFSKGNQQDKPIILEQLNQ